MPGKCSRKAVFINAFVLKKHDQEILGFERAIVTYEELYEIIIKYIYDICYNY